MRKESYRFSRLIWITSLSLIITVFFLIIRHNATVACAEPLQNACASCPNSGEIVSIASAPQPLDYGQTADSISVRLLFPVQGFHPYTTPVSSVLDHDRALGIINAYTGERGRSVDGERIETTDGKLIDPSKEKALLDEGKTLLYGFLSSDKSLFWLTGQYTGGGGDDQYALWYENSNDFQHPGYDYPFSKNGTYTIVAPASGDLYIVIQDPSPDTLYSETWCNYHTFKIKIDNATGLETWFLHAERFVTPKEDGAGTRDLDAEVRNKMSGNAYYNCSRQVNAPEVKVGHVTAGEKLAIVGGWGAKNKNQTFPKHLHFEVRLNGHLIDPYGWEGDSDDPLPGNSEDVLWEGYTKPLIDSAVLNANSSTLTITGNNFVQADQNPIVQIWRRLENSSEPANKSDGTYVKNLSTSISPTDAQIVAVADQDVLDNFSNYAVKVRIPNGPRSKGSAINPLEMWTKMISGADTNGYLGPSVQQTTDGGYVVVGTVFASPSGNRDILLLKLDTLGSVQWSRSFGGPYDDFGYSVQQTTDGGYIVGGTTYVEGAGVQVVLIKTDCGGNEQWTKTFVGPYGGALGYSVQQTTDGGYIITGQTAPPSGYNGSDVILIKCDAGGQKQWTKVFGLAPWDEGYCGNSVQQTTDGGYIIAGWDYICWWDCYQHIVLIKTDPNGELLWRQSYLHTRWPYDHPWAMAFSVQQTVDGGYIIGGTESYFPECYATLIKTDADGNEQWYKHFGGSDYNWNGWGTSVQQTSDEGFVITGYAYPLDGGAPTVLIIKTDEYGNEQWSKIFSIYDWSEGRSVKQTTDGGYIIAGGAYSYTSSSYDIILIKTDANGKTILP